MLELPGEEGLNGFVGLVGGHAGPALRGLLVGEMCERECSFNCVNGLNNFRQITLLP